MSLKKNIVFAIIGLFVLFSGFVMAETYVVGTSAGFPPFEYVENGEVVGFDIDLLREIGKLKGFDIEVKDISFDSLIAALKSGNIDIIAAGMTITDARKEVVDFSIPYYSANQSVIVQNDSDDDITVLFGNHKIGVQTGTTGDLWVTETLKDKGILTGEIKRYDTFVYVINDLVNGNLDGVVLDTPVAKRYSEIKPVNIVAEIITGEEYGIAVNKGNTELMNKINEGIEELIENGTMDQLIAKYF
ncbi:MAG: basic amino acid ABC transporter substrate-binding protein [Halanaerobiaceae bacterium]|jgi:polar amino acid transport system substrate-binding protein|nr:basic amino acid ABC transporter substrate-binding protein [Halanaerobiaceae bacterium]